MAKHHNDDKVALDRLVFFSDAVFAIAITLLALEIRLPVEVGPLSNDELFTALVEAWPKILGFIISFLVMLGVWMAYNAARGSDTFDPYPFILLNLVLSCLAALQAPIIMMSQKRQEAKDRARSLNDYQVNLKAELEIRHLHEKLDHLISKQWQRLAEIQQLQLEIMQDRRR